MRLGNDGNLVVHTMLRKRSLVRCAANTPQRHVIKRCEYVWNLPFRIVSFGQVQNIRVPGIQPVPEALKARAIPRAKTDNVDVEIPQPI